MTRIHLFPSLMMLLGPLTAVAMEKPYPRAELLIEPAELAAATSRFVVLDARPQKAYDAGHVPGAFWVDHAAWAKAFGDGQDVSGWEKRIGALGIDSETRVVVYDDNHAKDASRIWWILRYWGVQDVRLLHGGWHGWISGKHPLEKKVSRPTATRFVARLQKQRLSTKDQLLQSLDKEKLQVVDTRSSGEYCGTDPLKNKRAGAIPGAKHLEWSDLLDKKTHRFKGSAVLRQLFENADIHLERPTATYCQSGGRAAVMAFALELMGAKNVSNYYRSWSEWGNATDTPIMKPRATKPE